MTTRQEWYVDNDDADGANLGTNTNWEAQEFKIGTTGGNFNFDVSSVDIKLRIVDGIDLTIRIYKANPDGSPNINGGVISSGSVVMASLAGTLWQNISMSAISLQKDQIYCLVVLGTTALGDNYWREDASTPLYSGGSHWGSADSGGSWTEASGVDKLFQINGGDYAGTLCTLAEASTKAGVNASANSTNEVIVSNFVLQAEGVINATTRFDWVNAYSGLTNQVKYLLNRIVSAMAAIDIINYDMSGYTVATAEAETMINVLREEQLMGLSLLRDQKVKVFMTGDT